MEKKEWRNRKTEINTGNKYKKARNEIDIEKE